MAVNASSAVLSGLLKNNMPVNVVNSHSYLGVTVSLSLAISVGTSMLTIYWPRLPKLNFIHCNVYCCPPDTQATAYISLVRPHLEYAAAAWDPYLVGDCKQLERSSVVLLVLLNETTDERHRCLLLFLNFAGKPSVIVEETVTHFHLTFLSF